MRLSFLLCVACLVILPACKKQALLNERPNSQIIVPSTLEDMQNLLDRDATMSETPQLGELSADNYYLSDAFWNSLDAEEHNAYVWAKDVFGAQENIPDWNKPYEQVLYANVVLESLPKIAVTGANEQQWQAIKGAALFIRAYAFYNLAQVFAPVYDDKTSASDLGIALRLSSGVDNASVRATVDQTYGRILQDLHDAENLLPAAIDSAYRNRPSRPACMALLARVYTSMRNYVQAGAYADSCLRLYNKLIDYNAINVAASYPFTRLNDETMYQGKLSSATRVLIGKLVPECVVDSMLYRSYAAGDLRRQVFYTLSPAGLPNIKGSYNGTLFAFSGLATDEMYLVRAECSARAGNTTAALEDLNTLLNKRYKKGSFTAITAASAGEALQKILEERRKELSFRGLRWTDIRRLNKEGTGITLTRRAGGQTYRLTPGDAKYVLPIPPDVIALSGMQQNLR